MAGYELGFPAKRINRFAIAENFALYRILLETLVTVDLHELCGYSSSLNLFEKIVIFWKIVLLYIKQVLKLMIWFDLIYIVFDPRRDFISPLSQLLKVLVLRFKLWRIFPWRGRRLLASLWYYLFQAYLQEWVDI